MRSHHGVGLAALVIGEDSAPRRALASDLRGLGCTVVESDGMEEAAALARGQAFDVAFVDPGTAPGTAPGSASEPAARGATGSRSTTHGSDGALGLLPSLVEASPRLDVVVVSASASVRTAVESIQRGAHDFLPRPFAPLQLRHLVERTAARRALERQVLDLRSQLGRSAPEADLETRSPRMRALLGVLGHAAAHDVAVLLGGEVGTGKSVLARRLHAMSSRRAHPFVVVNCAALAATPSTALLEERLGRVLFGDGLGPTDEPARVEMARGGTLFLDEVAGIPPAIQARLLRLLDDGDYQRAGDDEWRTSDVRVVAATQVELEAEVAAGRFRRDLLQRLDTVTIEVPPLRERREDILPLADRFLAFFGRLSPRAPLELTMEAREALLTYFWPGNVRELRNAIERAVILSVTSKIGPELLPRATRPLERPGRDEGPASGRGRRRGHRDGEPAVGGDFTLEELEREHTLRVMARTDSLDEAARILGVDAQTLWRRRKQYEEH